MTAAVLPNLRKMFVPHVAGNVFGQVDYAGAELRVVACLSRDEGLAEILRDPSRDMMSEVAEEFFGADFDKEQRTKAKTVVHGINYGRTKVGLAQGMGITEQEAQKFIDIYFGKFPKVKAWHQSVFHTVFNSDDYLTTPFGRRRRFTFVTPWNRHEIEKEALAFLPQSIASDICISAMIQLVNEGYPIRLPVHDSLMVECKAEEALDTCRHMATVMSGAAEAVFDFVPFPCDIEIGPSWGELMKEEEWITKMNS